ncbi:MAG: hypothetical protein R3362_07090, partial [Rhodothermales bacterium]|nr:hypothetical protein [Rhodothermales bacterium]
PAEATAVVVASPNPPRTCFTDAYGAFLSNGWDILETTPGGFDFRVRPDATEAVIEVTIAESEVDADDAVLVARLDADTPERRDVLERTARLLAQIPGVVSFR